MKLLLLIILLSVAATVNGCCNDNSCTCEPNCWEQCFLNPPNNFRYKQAYKDIYRMVVGIRNLYAPCFKPHGTAYMIDSAVPTSNPFGLFQYQRELATIVAMSQPVGDDCNQFTASKYFRNFAFYSHNWPCKSRCEAYRLFQGDLSMRFFLPDSSSSWVRGGEILSKLAFDRPHLKGHECMNCTSNELLIAFSNSHMNPVPSSFCNPGQYHCAVVAVHPAPYPVMKAWSNSGVHDLAFTGHHFNAARRIRSCMYTSCCRQYVTWWNPPKVVGRETDEEEAEVDSRASATETQTFEVQVSDSCKKDRKCAGKYPSTFKGSFKDFSKKFASSDEDQKYTYAA